MHRENTKLIMINVLIKCKLSVYEMLVPVSGSMDSHKLAKWC